MGRVGDYLSGDDVTLITEKGTIIQFDLTDTEERETTRPRGLYSWMKIILGCCMIIILCSGGIYFMTKKKKMEYNKL
ncbi:MAG: hypothetical protein HXS53_08040 [Theionarchaea archaeon]|nr:hypothetical protein [Theionarchaea archaeon]